MIDHTNISIIYSGDDVRHRIKHFGASLIDQMLYSVQSIRVNWSKEIPIYFTHTNALSPELEGKLTSMGIQPLQSARYLIPGFPLGNKINFAAIPVETDYTLFLDCDTVVHREVRIESDAEFLVAFDALQALEEKQYEALFSLLDISFPKGHFVESPAYEYYYGNQEGIFPSWNSGVFFIESAKRHKFAECWHKNLMAAHKEFSQASWSFYLEQVCFVATVFELNLNYQILPKGYNYISTPRAPFLRDWDRDEIYIEHYAGDSGRPIPPGQHLARSLNKDMFATFFETFMTSQ